MNIPIHARSLPTGPRRAALFALLAAQLTACGSPDECHEGDVYVRSCGLNDRGTQSITCTDGEWEGPGACEDADVCKDGDSDSQACGLNGRGAQSRHCVTGAWGELDACKDPDVCTDGASQSVACGPNGQGTQTATCTKGAWTSSDCVAPAACNDGDTWQEACGVLGVRTRQCVGMAWGDYGPCDDPPSLQIHVPGRRDMVHDAKRHRVYITAGGGGGGRVLVFDLVTRKLAAAPLLTGGDFLGIDLSPDQDRLLVADMAHGQTKNWVHEIELTMGTSKKVEFDLDFYESGTYSVAFTSDTQALVTSMFAGSGWVPLRRVDLAGLAAETIDTVGQDTMLAGSADGSKIAYAESNSSGGEWGSYDIAAKTIAKGMANAFLYEIAVSRDASQYAIPTYIGLEIHDGALKLLTSVGGSAGGAVYSPVADELYVAWSEAATSLEVYSTATLQKVRDIDATPSLFGWIGNHGFGDGRLRISRDGALLLATRGDELLLYHTSP